MTDLIESDHSSPDDFRFCTEYLPKVSRTFAINIRILKGNAYKGVLLAYLFCRIADTIEDDHYFPPRFKISKLREFSELFPPQVGYQEHVKAFLKDITFPHPSDSSTLLLNSMRVFKEMAKLPASIISVISRHVKEMALGMARFQEKEFSKQVAFLENQAELEQYCYYVAGTVGLMLTALFSECSDTISPDIRSRLEQRSVAFGLGLQMTNIAKDFLGDRTRGWCYIPKDFFVEEGIDPFSHPFADGTERLFRVQKRLISLALTNLDEALLYSMDIPRTLVRYRLFCLWPLFMAVKTLGKLYHEQRFLPDQVVKITRADVKRIVRSTSLAVFSNRALRLLYCRMRPVIC